MFWLQAAAGNAMNGQLGNMAQVVGGGVLELVPATVEAQGQGKLGTSHLVVDAA